MSDKDERTLKAVRHVVHDYVCLVSAGTSIYGNPKPPINSHVQYSFLLHCRKFAHFFMDRKPRDGMDDMLAQHFIGKRIEFKLGQWQKWDTHMAKHLFHLSYDRLDDWPPWTGHTENKEMLDEFRAAWRLFLANLPDRLRQKFDQEMEKKLALGDFRGLDV